MSVHENIWGINESEINLNGFIREHMTQMFENKHVGIPYCTLHVFVRDGTCEEHCIYCMSACMCVVSGNVF